MNKKAQLGLNSQGVLSLIIIGILLIIILPLITTFFNSISGGSIQNSLDSLINAFIPLFFLAVIFEFIRRFFR